MNNYKVIAYNNKFKIIHIQYQANSETELREILASAELQPIAIHKKSSDKKQNKIKINKDLGMFTEQLDVLLQSGLNLHHAVQLAVSSIKKGRLYNILHAIIIDLEKGMRFSTLLARSGVFPQYYIEIVAVSERGNTQAEVFHELAKFLRTEIEYKEKMASVLLYPILVCTLLIVGITLFFTLFIPYYVQLMDELIVGDEYNIYGRIQVAYVIGYVLFGTIVCLCVVYYAAKFFPKLRILLHALVLKIPILKHCVMYYNLMWVCFLIKCLLEGGDTLPDAIQYSAKMVKNIPIATALERVAELLERGISPSQAIKETPLLPELMRQWLIIGEQSSNKQLVFAKMHGYFQYQMNYMLNIITSLIQPVVTIIIGIIIILVIQLLITPLFQIYNYM